MQNWKFLNLRKSRPMIYATTKKSLKLSVVWAPSHFSDVNRYTLFSFIGRNIYSRRLFRNGPRKVDFRETDRKMHAWKLITHDRNLSSTTLASPYLFRHLYSSKSVILYVLRSAALGAYVKAKQTKINKAIVADFVCDKTNSSSLFEDTLHFKRCSYPCTPAAYTLVHIHISFISHYLICSMRLCHSQSFFSHFRLMYLNLFRFYFIHLYFFPSKINSQRSSRRWVFFLCGFVWTQYRHREQLFTGVTQNRRKRAQIKF